MALRDYQQCMDDRRRASQSKSRCNQSPTGSGKSHLIRATIYDAPSVAVMAHREYLVDQLARLAPDAQVIKAGVPWDRKSKKIIGMVQTLCRRDPDDLPRVDAVVTDECHHIRGKTYKAVLDFWPGAEHDGYTATPIRLDGQGLDDCYDELICGPQYRELIDRGHLKPFELYSIPSGVDMKSLKVVGGDYSRASQNDAIRKSTIFGDVVEYWQKLGRDGPHISFWPSIEAAEHAADQVPGWQVLHSKLPGGSDAVRERIEALKSGSIESLASVDIVGEGLDIPGVASVSRCRSTKSLGLYMQQSGRCNRGGEGVARVISHVDDWRQHGHGFPDDDRTWSLKGVVKQRAEAGVLSVWDCPECWAINRSQVQSCQRCGCPKPREIVIIEQRAAELELIKRASINDIHDHCRTGEDYVTFAKAKGKKPSFGVLRFWERSNKADADDPFMEALGHTIRPTLQQFEQTARQCGVHAAYAREAGRAMRLMDEEENMKVFQG